MSQHLIRPFQLHLKALGKRPGTQETYLGVFQRFLLWTATQGRQEPDAACVYDFLIMVGNRERISPQWYNVNFHALRTWLVMCGFDANLRGLRPKQVPDQPPRWLTEDQTRRLLAAVEQRHFRTVFLTMLSTGLRISEVLALRVTDIAKHQPVIQVRCGKGGHGRLVRCETSLRELLIAYWKVYKPMGFLFQQRPGGADKPMQKATVNAALHRAAALAGITEPVSSHRLRHTFAITCLRGGMDLVTLGKLMGHRCLSSTTRYVTPDLIKPGVMVDVLTRLQLEDQP
jgi:integrase